MYNYVHTHLRPLGLPSSDVRGSVAAWPRAWPADREHSLYSTHTVQCKQLGVLWDELFSGSAEVLLPCVQRSYEGPFTSAPHHTTASFVGEGILDVNELILPVNSNVLSSRLFCGHWTMCVPFHVHVYWL